MKTLVAVQPWWTIALMFTNLSLAGTVLLLRRWSGMFQPLIMLRVYLWYCCLSVVACFVALCLTPVGAWSYWYTASAVNALFDVVTFLLCAQVIDQAIHRKSVALVKSLVLLLCPTVLGIVIVWKRIYPFLHIRQSLTFDVAFAVTSAAVLAFSFQEPSDLGPDEVWIRDYRQIVQGLAVQLAAMCCMKFFNFPSTVAEISSALASMTTLVLFALAVSPRTRAGEPSPA